MKAANNNNEGPWVSPAHAEMSAGLAELRSALGMPEEMCADSYEVVVSKPRVRPARNFRDQAGVDDAE
jgi:hypothetical protein